jgi:hypothetical protein
MSASNYAACPRCLARAKAAVEAQVRAVKAAYGEIPADAYMERINEAMEASAAAGRVPETFREDYEICGAETGTVTVSYSGLCETCGLSLGFREDYEICGLTDGAS